MIYVRNKFCSSFDTRCLKEAYRLSDATYLDIDYDSIPRNLVLTSFHYESPRSQPWDERIQLDESSAKIEIGVLSSGKTESLHELSLEGFLTVVGESKKPSTNPQRLPSNTRSNNIPLQVQRVSLSQAVIINQKAPSQPPFHRQPASILPCASLSLTHPRHLRRRRAHYTPFSPSHPSFSSTNTSFPHQTSFLPKISARSATYLVKLTSRPRIGWCRNGAPLCS